MFCFFQPSQPCVSNYSPSCRKINQTSSNSHTRDDRLLESTRVCQYLRYPILMSVPPQGLPLISYERHPLNSHMIDYIAWANLSRHALNTAFVLFEIIFTHVGPAPWIHLPFVIFFGVAYLGIVYITHATQGFYSASSFLIHFSFVCIHKSSPISILVSGPPKGARLPCSLHSWHSRRCLYHFCPCSTMLRSSRTTLSTPRGPHIITSGSDR
jgi:hypothetical protein